MKGKYISLEKAYIKEMLQDIEQVTEAINNKDYQDAIKLLKETKEELEILLLII